MPDDSPMPPVEGAHQLNRTEMREVRALKTKQTIRLAVSLVAILVVVLVVVTLGFKGCASNPKKVKDTTRTPVESTSTAQPPASLVGETLPPVYDDSSLPQVISGGVPNYGAILDWLATQPADKQVEFLRWANRMNPNITLTSLVAYAAEEAKGKNYAVKIPAGSTVVNTYRNKDGKIQSTKPYRIKTERWALTDKYGNIWIFIKCGNVIRVIMIPPGEKIEPCPVRNSDPNGLYTPHHPGTATYYNPPASVDPNASTYVNGNAERNEANRGTGPGQSGSAGTGSGGVTPPATTNGDTGSSETNQGGGQTDTTTNEDVSTNTTGTPP